jgi:hypothetical protein
MRHNTATNSAKSNEILYSSSGAWMAIEQQLDVYGSSTTVPTTERTMNQTDKNNEQETIEVTSSWFTIKMQEINGYTLAATAMILAALVAIVWIVAQ